MKKKTEQRVTPEWSHKIDVESIEKKPCRISISATSEQRKDITRRLRIESIETLQASFTIERESGGNLIHVEGAVSAQVHQFCAITLVPLQSDIEETFEAWFADQEQAVPLEKVRRERMSKLVDSELPLADERDDPEPVIEGFIDLGELATQYLSLAINPYPHAEGAFSDSVMSDLKAVQEPVRKNPFAALKDWKIGQEKKK